MSHKDLPYEPKDHVARFREHYREVAAPLTRWHQVAYQQVNEFLAYCNKQLDVKVQLCPKLGVQDKTIHLVVNVQDTYCTDMPVALHLQSIDDVTEAHNIIFAKVGDAKGSNTEPMLLQDQFECYPNLLDAILRQAAIFKSAQDSSISRGMRVTQKNRP